MECCNGFHVLAQEMCNKYLGNRVRLNKNNDAGSNDCNNNHENDNNSNNGNNTDNSVINNES